MTIGEKIRAVRMGREFTQKKLSEVCGVAEISIRNYENNKRQPTIEQLQKIADGLSVRMADLLEEKSNAAYQDDYSFCPLIRDTCKRNKCAWASHIHMGTMCCIRTLSQDMNRLTEEEYT